jgi:hypothetical protein
VLLKASKNLQHAGCVNGSIVISHEPQATTFVASNQFIELAQKLRLKDIIHDYALSLMFQSVCLYQDQPLTARKRGGRVRLRIADCLAEPRMP